MTRTATSNQADTDKAAIAQALSWDERLGAGWKPPLLLLAIMPLLHALATWDWDGHINVVNHALRLYSLPVVGIELIVLWWAARRGWHPTKHFSKLPKVAKLLFVALFISVALSTIFSSISPITSALFAGRYCLHLLLASSLVFLISDDPKFDLNCWVSVFFWGTALYIISLIIFCLFVIDPENFLWVERLPSATNVRQIGNVLGLLALIPATQMIFNSCSKKMATTGLLLIVLMTFIMWTGTRGALLGFAVAICIAGLHNINAIIARRAMLVPALCFVALSISIFIPTPAPEFGIIRIAESIVGTDASSGRWYMWQTAYEAIQSAPNFGHGAGTYRDHMVVANGYPYNHPHNFILQAVYDWGIVGGGLVLALLGWLGFTLFASTDGPSEQRFLSISGYVGLLTIGMIEGTLFHPLPIVIVIALMSPQLVCHRTRATLP